MSAWPVAQMLALVTRTGGLDALRIPCRRHPVGCTGQICRVMADMPGRIFSVTELRAELDRYYSGRRVNSALQKLVAQGEVRVARLGNPKGYQWAG